MIGYENFIHISFGVEEYLFFNAEIVFKSYWKKVNSIKFTNNAESHCFLSKWTELL